jgi:hypothetical protein
VNQDNKHNSKLRNIQNEGEVKKIKVSKINLKKLIVNNESSKGIAQ